ncbi:MAG: PQQ-binding-like beta-propeller repeat protein [Firmicutes bacterium]|nr:PQQ-binding-like beta-propeller repeat protein [Bacillota bacterium]
MKINDSSSIQNPYLTQGKPAPKQAASVFGNDQVQTTGQVKPQFGLSQNQISSLFEKGPKSTQSTPANFETKLDGFENSYNSCLFGSDGSFYSVKNDRFCKFDGKTGDTQWVRDLASPFTATNEPLIEGKDGSVLANCKDNKLRAFDPATGDEKWNMDLGAAFNTPVKVLNNGDIAVMRKVEDHLCFTRLGQNGKEKNTIQLGFWDEPIGTPPISKTIFVNEEPDGNLLVQGFVLEGKKEGTNYVPMDVLTYCITPDDKIKWTVSGFDPPASFSDNPDRLFRVDYDRIQCYDKSNGQEVWIQKKDYLAGKNCGDTFFTIAGEQKHKYIKFVDSRDGKLILQSYAEGPLRTTKSGEEIICVDQNDLNKTYWKKDSAGSIFKGPLYVDKDTIIHISDEDTGTLEALDPATGNSKWTVSLNEQFFRPDGKQEMPDIKKAAKADDGSFFVLTKHGVYGLDGQSGQITSAAISPGELTQFQVDTKSKTITAVDNKNNTVRQFNMSTLNEQKVEAFKKETEQAPAQEQASPTIQETEKEVIIGGITLKKANK